MILFSLEENRQVIKLKNAVITKSLIFGSAQLETTQINTDAGRNTHL